MGGWTGMIEPMNMHGSILFCLRPSKECGPRLYIPVVLDSLQAIQGSCELEVSVWGGNEEILRGM